MTVERGERLLAWTESPDGTVGGTRDALYLPDGSRLPWEEVEAADWDHDESTLTVTEVGSWGELRGQHRLLIEEPGRLLELVRERVTASVVLQRHVAVDGRRGLRVIARRAPRGDRPLVWVFEYDEGVDPDDPVVRALAEDALAAARTEVG
ncbi:hypothetical protein [Nocardioides sp. W7]|uniref:hypothetical protein n=1 Tax=Nocardioides sp. W7 TaxID=2931390 RepID=UPI001FD487CA|nr:hypothetical protein [Nocardioides sp. W7]